MEILTLIFAWIVLLLPLIFWMYIFIVFEHLGITRRDFFIWIVAGVFTTLPLVYSEFIFFWPLIEETFFQLSFIGNDFFGFMLFGKIFTFFAGIFLVLILLSKYILRKNVRKFIYSAAWYSMIILLSCILIYVIYFWLFDVWGDADPVYSWNLVFSWLWAIAWYYIVVSLLEEGMKYLWNVHFLTTKNTQIHFSRVLVLSAVVALWFSFFENILYTYIYYSNSGTDWLVSLVFFRSLFTVSLHILCSMLLLTAFYMILVMRKQYKKSYILFFLFSSISIGAHMLFDVSLSFWYTFMVLFYLFALYILLVFISSPDESHQSTS